MQANQPEPQQLLRAYLVKLDHVLYYVTARHPDEAIVVALHHVCVVTDGWEDFLTRDLQLPGKVGEATVHRLHEDEVFSDAHDGAAYTIGQMLDDHTNRDLVPHVWASSEH